MPMGIGRSCKTLYPSAVLPDVLKRIAISTQLDFHIVG